ncbi:MAG: hypothetical protein OXT74_09655 [Candidatus Poribacteria bacterium]|nr:hypothetical protein [Candidatus Poribacteria bacterium]
MYFIQYDPLKEKLRTKSLSDREALPYAIILFILEPVLLALPVIGESNEYDVALGILIAVIGLGGLIYCYDKNGGRNGFDLIQKYVVLQWIVTVRCIPFFLLGMIVIFAAKEFLGMGDENTSGIEVVGISLMGIVFYLRLGRHIRDTGNSA